MSARAKNILKRFPAHLEAAREGKRLSEVTDALALDIDTLSAALARVRRARRLLDADELRDLLRIGALHGITLAELAVLFTRFDLARTLLKTAATSDQAAEQLIALWGIADASPRLPKYSPRKSVVAFAQRALASSVLLDGIRRRIGAICANHARGNGTIRAADRRRRQRARSRRAVRSRTATIAIFTSPSSRTACAWRTPKWSRARPWSRSSRRQPERLLVEENPLTAVKTDETARKHGELFSVPAPRLRTRDARRC